MARLRTGELSPDRLLLAALCRDEVAWRVLDRPYIPCGPLTESGYDFAVRFSFANLPDIHWGEFCRGLRRWPECIDTALAAIASDSCLAAEALAQEDSAKKWLALGEHYQSPDHRRLRQQIEAAVIEWATR